MRQIFDKFLDSWRCIEKFKSLAIDQKMMESLHRVSTKKTNSELSLWQPADGLVYDFLILTLPVLVFHHRNEECCWANIICLSEVVY